MPKSRPSPFVYVVCTLSESNFVNREKRFEINESVGFDAIVKRDGSDENVFYASLIDFSRKGGKFEVPFCARFDETLEVNLEFKDFELTYNGSGRVRHIRNVGENRWQVGCLLDPPLPEDLVAYLAKRTNQERRQHPRFDIVGEGKLRRQGTPEGCEAFIRNISRGGFCLIVPHEHAIGEIVDFVINEDATIDDLLESEDAEDQSLNVGARVRWQTRTHEGYTLGCSFTDAKSYSKLVDYLLDGQGVKSDKNSWVILAAAVVAMLIPVASSLLSRNVDQVVERQPQDEQIVRPSTDTQSGMIVNNAESEVANLDVAIVRDAAEQQPPIGPTTPQASPDTSLVVGPPQSAGLQETQESVERNQSDPQPPATTTLQSELPDAGTPVPTQTTVALDTPPANPLYNPRAESRPSSRRTSRTVQPQAVLHSSPAPTPTPTPPNTDGVPAVLSETTPVETKSRMDRGSSRRVQTKRPIMVESEEIPRFQKAKFNH